MWQLLFSVLFFANGLAMNAVGLQRSDSSRHTNPESTMTSAPGFTLRFTAKEAPAIGYAYIFACAVLEGEKAAFAGKSLSMTVLPGNKPVLETFRKAIANGETLIGKFEWQRDRCEYRHTT
ncbi:MAG: hypothetical protein RLZZ519_3097, partial [Bacteroidota bacterium]